MKLSHTIAKIILAALLIIAATSSCGKQVEKETTPAAGSYTDGTTTGKTAAAAIATGTTPTQKFPGKTLTVTRTIRPTRTQRPTRTPLPSATPTSSPTPTTTATQTEIPRPKINVFIRTCDTGVDIAHGMGEVTNAYITIQNLGSLEAENLEVVLSASDEDRQHPDKSYAVQHLPAGYEIALKLTVDTKNNTDTTITVSVVESSFIIEETTSRTGCTSRLPDTVVIDSLKPLFTVREVQ